MDLPSLRESLRAPYQSSVFTNRGSLSVTAVTPALGYPNQGTFFRPASLHDVRYETLVLLGLGWPQCAIR